MKTSEVLATLYLISMAVIMSGDNIISAECKDFCLGVFDHLRLNWIIYAANLFTVLYIVALAVNERKLEDEKSQSSNTSLALNESQKNILDTTETEKDTANDSSDDDSGISTNSKCDTEEKANLRPAAKEDSRQELILQIKDILLGEPKNIDEEQDAAKENNSFLDDTPLSPTEDICETPQQCEEERYVTINDGEWSDSSYDVSMDDISSYKLHTIEEESSLNSDGSPLNDATGRMSVSSTRGPSTGQQEHVILPVYTFSEPHNLVLPVRVSNAEPQSHHERQQYNVPAAETSLTTENDIQNTKSVGLNFSETQESEVDMGVREETPNSNVSTHGSFADVSSMLSPGIFSFSQKSDTDSLKQIWSPGSPTCESLLNTSFSVSSLEDFQLSPGIRVPTASPHVNSDQSLHGQDSRVLGIRLHKPRGFKDVFLSIVGIDKEGLDTISETWTLGTQEDMELVLSVDTNSDSSSSKQYCGRYSLAFNGNNELDSFLDAAATSREDRESFGFSFSSVQDEKEADAYEEKTSLEKARAPEEDFSSMDSFLEAAGTSKERLDFSFLSGQDDKEYAAEEETSFEEASAPEEDYNKLSTSCFGRLVWKVARSGQTEYDVISCDTNVDHALEEMNLELFHKDEETDKEEASSNESLSTEIAVKLCNVSHELLHRERKVLMHAAMTAGCLFLTCFVLYRCAK